MRPLTPKQQRFVDEFLVDLNATQAAVRAGYSAKTARQIGEQNLSKLDIRNAIVVAQEARQQRTQIDADWALKRLKYEAEYYGRGSSHAARVAAITTALKHFGLLNEQQQHTGPAGGPIPHDVFTLTPGDILAARRLVGVAFGGVLEDGGREPTLDPTVGQTGPQLAG